MPLSREPQLDPFDIKLLRLFLKVVEFNGFSGAQAELNVSATTISTQMATLESRLGMRLCDRGRVGFRLTDKGVRVHAAALRLEEAISQFRGEMGELRGKLVGELVVGIVDSTFTNPEFRLDKAISLFTARDNSVHIKVIVDDPSVIERKLLDGKINIGIAAFYHHVPGLTYQRLLLEEHRLYCGRAHSLYGKSASEVSIEDVMGADAVVRGYVTRQASVVPGLKAAATAFNMEATLMMVRSGSYIGHLPQHYAQDEVEKGDIWEVPCQKFAFSSVFEVAFRNGADELRLLRAFLSDLRGAHGG